MTTLNPLALTYESVLRALATTPDKPWTLSSLAGAAGKDKSTLRRALPAMREADLLGPEPDFILGDAGRAALALLDGGGDEDEANAVRAMAPGDAPEGYAGILHGAITPSPLNPRKDFDDAEIDELAASIKEKGLQQNLVVRPGVVLNDHAHPMHILVAGERRWRAIGKLIAAGDWPADRPIACKISDLDDEGHAEIALLENLVRKDLKPLEEARQFKLLVERFGRKTADIAKAIGVNQRVVQQRLQLLELDAADQQQLDEGKINLERARQILASRPKPFNLPPAEALMLLEIAHRVRHAWKDNWYKAVPIGDPTGDATVDALAKRGLANKSVEWNTARWQVNLGYQARRALAEITGIADPETGEIADVGMDLRIKLGAIPAGGANYVTTWLNEPYALSKDGLANIARRQDEAAEGERRRAEEQDRLRTQSAACYALADTLREATATVTAEATIQALGVLGFVGPFTVDTDEGEVVDAKGAGLVCGQWETPPAVLAMVAILLNAAIGVTDNPDVLAAARNDDGDATCEVCGDPLDERGACANCAAEDAEAGDDAELHPAARRLVEPAE